MEPHVFGYLRVSKGEQDLEKNKADILLLANELRLGYVEFVEEKMSGRVSWRKRRIAEIISSSKAGDVLIVSELSRLGRSMLECMEILSIATEKELRVYAVKGNWRLDNSIQSKIVAMGFAMASEIERELISLRTTEALAARKAKGLPLGRPKGVGKSKLDDYKEEILALLNNGSTKTWIARRYRTTPGNLRHWLKQHGTN
jgi:DNA invertase Pin-like site-specific DNA recombinase